MLMEMLHGMQRMCSSDDNDYSHCTYFHDFTTAGAQARVHGQCKVMGQEVYVGEVPWLC